MLTKLQPLVGLVGILGLAYALSTNRKAISGRVVGWGLSLQLLFALIVLKTEAGQTVFRVLGDKMRELLNFSKVGSAFVFGSLGDGSVWSRVMTGALGAEGANYGTIFAFQILPTIIFIAALFAILYYLGVMQIIVRMLAIVMNKVDRKSVV